MNYSHDWFFDDCLFDVAYIVQEPKIGGSLTLELGCKKKSVKRHLP